jgi:hypothetical protein
MRKPMFQPQSIHRAKSITSNFVQGFLALLVVVMFFAYLVLAINGPEIVGHEDYCNSPMGYRDVRCVGAFTLQRPNATGR